MKTRHQLNTLVPPELKNAVVTVAEKSPFNQGEIVEVALAVMFGSKDKLMVAKREKIVETFEKTGIKLPFEMPLAPFSNNVLTAHAA